MRAVAFAVSLTLLLGSAGAQARDLTTNRKPNGHVNERGNPVLPGRPCAYREADEACPSNAVAEGEPVCGDEYVDETNGGCNSTPPVYTDVPCGPRTICGEYGNYIGPGSLEYRDTDWYQFTACEDLILNATLCGSASNVLYIVTGIEGCAPLVVALDAAGPGQQAEVSYPVPSGETVVVFVALSNYVGTPCGSPYILRIWPEPIPPGFNATGVGPTGSPALLDQPAPNPFTKSTRMAFAVNGSTPQNVEVAVFNVAGQKVKILLQGVRSPGRYEAAWDGLDESGLDAPAGLYFFRVISGAEQTVRRVSLIR
jgi:hypothetical protein